MLKNAVRKSASFLCPGTLERSEYQIMTRRHIGSLKEDIKSLLQESDSASQNGQHLYASGLEHDATVMMRKLIEMGAF
ncbi:hypothetical protein NQF87_00075 [Bombella sp. TMW 2.2559]|uniref:Uncharacterized protein n=1 Tax=Bombella dulcis TaxID=2967339 RepID=A0ABT3W8I4_9PROT|nr:hypothetical protein [Bombella dulcis]MCX5615381.1 hypothetical protein [Bombella dulcis]